VLAAWPDDSRCDALATANSAVIAEYPHPHIEDRAAPSAYDDDPTARGSGTSGFTAMAIDAGLALGAVADTPVS